MRNFYHRLLLVIMVMVCFTRTHAQPDSTQPVKVAVFIPLYVDDVFNGYEYTLGKSNLPKSILPGLEFYNGVMMAVDMLKAEGEKVELHIYELKKPGLIISSLLNAPELKNLGLIIASITNPQELKVFADEGLRRNIPVISATYPNYVGVTDNPFFVLLNSSFQAHLDGLYKHMQRFYSGGSVLAITKKGGTEAYIKNYINELAANKSTIPLKIKWLSVDENNVRFSDFAASLDSTKDNVVFVASPLESFGLNVVKALSSNDNYRITAVGMPTWDGIRALNSKECANVEILFSTPFLYYSQNPSFVSTIKEQYKDKYYSRPSDMVYKGLETTYHFTKLLVKHKYNLINNLSDKDFTLFNQFDIEPVKLRKSSVKPDLLENKKLYFVKKQEGSVKAIL